MKPELTLQLPTVHMNGTPKQMLIDSLCVASQAIEAAYQAVKQTAPNGRDYYTQGAVAMEKAEAEHRERLRLLDKVKEEIDSMTVQIDKL